MKELWSAHAPAWSPRMRPVRPQSGNAPARSARSRPLAAARLGPPPRSVQNCQITTKCGDFRYTPKPPKSPHNVVIYTRKMNNLGIPSKIAEWRSGSVPGS